MRFARYLLLLALLTLLTVRFPARLTSAGLSPLWLYLPVLLYGLAARPGPALFLSWLTGLAVDMASLEPLGLHAFLFAGTAFLLVRLRGHLFSAHALTQFVLGSGATLLLCLVLLVRLDVAEPDFAMTHRILPALLLSLFTGAALPLLWRLDVRLGLTEGFREGERRV